MTEPTDTAPQADAREALARLLPIIDRVAWRHDHDRAMARRLVLDEIAVARPALPTPQEPGPMSDEHECICGADGGEGCWCCTDECPDDCTADHRGEQ